MTGSSKKNLAVSLLLIIAGILLFLPFLGSVHLFDWDEINFAECAREMVVTHKYFMVTINYLPFWEKPPLFIWMQALSMNLLGISDYAARLPNALCGIATLLVLYHIGKTWKDARFGLLWVLAYVGSILPQFYFKSGIIDPWFNFFIFTGVYFFARYRMQQKNILPCNSYKLLILSALCIGLGVLTKGPVAFLIFSLSVITYWLFQKGKSPIKFIHACLYILVFAVAGGSWFIAEILTGHWATVVEFFQYQIRLFKTPDAGHGGPFYFHFIILLVGCFPASIFAIRGMLLKTDSDEKMNEARLWMGILFWVVLILFSIVKTKIIHYSSLCYYPLTFFAALAAYKMLFENETWKKWMGWAIGIIGGIIGIALIGLPIVAMNKQAILNSGVLKDSFAAANLQADVHWSYLDCTIGLILVAAIVIGFIMVHQKKLKMGVIAIFTGTLITTNIMLIFSTPKIEMYSQDAAIEFYQSLAGKNVYVTTLDFKSFAQYFYSNEQPWTDVNATDTGWLVSGDIDKPAYFVCKIGGASDFEKKYPQLKELYRKNGFVFMERIPPIHK